MTYYQIVKALKDIASARLIVKSVSYGTISELDNNQNIEYPFVFYRPMTSPGLVYNPNNGMYTRELNFEMYLLDVPSLDSDGLMINSNMEKLLYDIQAVWNFNNPAMIFTVNSIAPVAEAFQDRTYGWVAEITLLTPGGNLGLTDSNGVPCA